MGDDVGLNVKDLNVTDGGEAWFVDIKNDFDNRRKTLLNLSRTPSASGDDCVPASAALSFRIAANALKYAMTQRSGRSSPGQRRAGGGTGRDEPPEVQDSADDQTDEELLSTMQGQWVEVECLLRVQLRSGPDALDEAVRTSISQSEIEPRARARFAHRLLPRTNSDATTLPAPPCPVWQRKRVSESLAFDNALGQRATDSGVLKGTIFQGLLARADGSEQASASSVGLSDVSDADWAEQAAGADALRKLVRIKVQDDNDLKAANGALSSCAEFFSNLALYASRQGIKEAAVIEKLEEGPVL